MNKLTRLTEKESAGEQPLDGTYRIVVDLNLSADKKVTVSDLEKKVAELGGVDDLYVERYTSTDASPFNVGDTIELAAEFNCDKDVYMDTAGNLVISDKVTDNVEKIGTFMVSLPEGTVAEINSRSSNGKVEVLFSGEAVHLEKLNRVAYLGILELPSSCLKSI